MWKSIAIAMLSLVCLVGCSTSNEQETAQVHGTVTLDGEPVTSGQVYFIPEGGRGAKGKINSDGTYTLSTYGEGDGAIVGPNKVFILANDEEGGQIESTGPVKSLVPERYTSPETSGLEVEVQAGESNEFPLKLTK